MSVTTDEPKRKYRTQPRPVCPDHGVLMVCRRTTPDVRYFYCQIDGCKQSVVQAKNDKSF